MTGWTQRWTTRRHWESYLIYSSWLLRTGWSRWRYDFVLLIKGDTVGRGMYARMDLVIPSFWLIRPSTLSRTLGIAPKKRSENLKLGWNWFWHFTGSPSNPRIHGRTRARFSKLLNWTDLDASRVWGFGVQIFHVKKEYATAITAAAAKWPPRTAIEPIMFLSRALTSAERSYWPTELEIADFVWTIKKVRHLVESSKLPVIIQIDHSAILDIIKHNQSSITSTTSTLRLNVRLIRASQCLKQFRLDVRHKPGKEHIVPDTLSRLASTKSSQLSEDHSELDVPYVCGTRAIDFGSSIEAVQD